MAEVLKVLNGPQWRTYAREHERRAGRFADPFVRRREQGQAHPVEDFLFTYYTLKPGQFKRWHPGAGVILLDAAERVSWKFYRAATEDELVLAGLSPDDAHTHAERGSRGRTPIRGQTRYRPHVHPRNLGQHSR